MTIEMVFTVIAAIAAITGILVNIWNVHRKGADDKAKSHERNLNTENKVDIIYNDVKEIKADLKAKDEMQTEHRMKLADHEKRLQALEKKAGD